MKALIFGCGYLGRRVAARWIDAGHHVSALTRSSSRAAELELAGIAPIIGDVTNAATLATLPVVDVVLYAVGYDRAAAATREKVVIGGLQNTLEAITERTDRLIFISTTSVYGQSQGEWIDEHSPTDPANDAGRMAVEAEGLSTRFRTPPQREGDRQHRGIRMSRPGAVALRLSGLYGPGRLLRRVEQLKSGEPIAGDGEAWLNLIHVDDAASAVIAAERFLMTAATREQDSPPTLLISDDRPVRRRDYYERLAQLADAPPPSFEPSSASRISGLGKRCRNSLMKGHLAVPLQYPTYEQGLAAAWAAD